MSRDPLRGGVALPRHVHTQKKLTRRARPPAPSARFADRDGTIDLVVTSCPKSTNHHQQRADCQISILYNRQIPLCDSSSSSSSAGGGGACRDPEALCTADPDFGFTTPDEDETTIIRVEDLAPSSSSGGGGRQQKRRRRRLVTHSAAGFKGSFPLLASVGDFNIDGYPDLLIVTADEHNPKDKRAQILESVPCSGGGGVRGGLDGGGGGAIAGCGGGGGGGSGGGDGRRRGRRGFRLVTNGAEALEQIDDVESAHWVDIDDDVSPRGLWLVCRRLLVHTDEQERGSVCVRV